MADDLLLNLRITGDSSGAVAAVNSLAKTVQASIGVNLSQSRAVKTATDSALGLARANSALQTVQGNLSGAQDTLTKALAGVEKQTIQTIRAQTQLASVQGKEVAEVTKVAAEAFRSLARAATEAAAAQVKAARDAGAAAKAQAAEAAKLAAAEKAAANQRLQLAQANARLQAAGGNLAGAQNTLKTALAGVTEQTLQTIRAQTQLANVQNRIGQIASGTNFGKLLGDLRTSISAFSGAGGGFGGIIGQIQSLASILPSVASAGTEAGAGLGAVSAAAGGMSAALGPVIIGVGLLVAGIGGIALIAGGAGSGLRSIAEEGIATNRQIESLQLGIATVIASVGDLRNSDGIQLRGLDALNAAIPLASDQMRKLRIDALQTAATFQDIAPALQAGLAPGLNAGLTLDQVRKNVISITQAVTAIGLPLDQIKQETRAILSGEINRNTQAAIALGITRQAALEAQKQGKFAEFLEEKLREAAAAGALVAKTFEAATSNLQEARSTLFALVSEGLFDQLRDKANEVLPKIFDLNSSNLISNNLNGIADLLTRIFDTAGKTITDLIDFVVKGIQSINQLINENRSAIGAIIQSFDEIVRIVGLIIGDFVSLISGSDQWGTRIRFVDDVLLSIVAGMGNLRDLIKVVTAGFQIAGSTVVQFLLTPLEAVADITAAIASLIPGLGDKAAAEARAIKGIREAAENAAKQGEKNLVEGMKNFGKTGAEAVKRIEEARKRAAADVRAVPGLGRKTPADTGAKLAGGRGRAKEDEDGKKAAAAAREQAKQELKDLQLNEKEAELRNRRETEQLKDALQARILSIQDFTQKAIDLDNILLATRLATFKAEESAAVRTAKTKAEADVKRREISLKADQAILDSERRQQELREAQQNEELKNEESRFKRLLELREAIRDQETQAVGGQVKRNQITNAEAEAKLLDLERERFDDRKALIERGLALETNETEEKRRLTDELKKLSVERATFETEALEREQEARAKDAALFSRYINARVEAVRGLRAAQLDLQRAQADVLKQFTATRSLGVGQDLEAQREIARLSSADNERSISEQFEQVRRRAVEAKASAAELIEIEKGKNAALVIERARLAIELQAIDAKISANERLSGGGFQSLFSERVQEMASQVGLAKAVIEDFSKSIEDSIVSIDEIGKSAFLGFAEGIGSAVQNYVLLGKTGPAVIRKLLAEQLAAIAKEAAVNSIKELALGFGALFINPPAAAGHFTSAALWAGLAGGAAIVGRAVAPSQNTSSGDTFGNSGGATGGEDSQQPIVINQERRIIENIITIRPDQAFIVSTFTNDYKSDGDSRKVINDDQTVIRRG